MHKINGEIHYLTIVGASAPTIVHTYADAILIEMETMSPFNGIIIEEVSDMAKQMGFSSKSKTVSVIEAMKLRYC